jgi:hypothetical protein
MSGIEWTLFLGLGIGIAILIHAILDSLQVFLYRLIHGHSAITLLPFTGTTAPPASLGVHKRAADLLGLERIPWLGLYGVAGLLAVLVYLQTHWLPGLLLALLPVGGRAWLTSLRKRRMRRDTWHFLMDLRLRLGLKGSLLTALMELARDGQSPLAALLRDYLRADREGGLAILSRMAADTRLPYLEDVIARVEAAQAGTLRLDEALRQAMQRLQEETETHQREQLQKIPARLILLAFPGLLGPALFVLVFPLVARVIAALQGLSWGGGF